MRLEDFVHEHGTVNAIAGGDDLNYILDAPLPKNLHVIGDCGDCDSLEKAGILCPIYKLTVGRLSLTNFGCLEFKKKEDK